MGSAGRPKPADFDLSERLASRGIVASAGRLRHLRSEAQIPGPDRLPDGRYLYSAEAEDYAADLLELLTLRPNLSLATLTLFGRRRLPRESALKRGYAAEIRRWSRFLNQHGNKSSTPQDVAEAVVAEHSEPLEHSALGRSIKDRVHRLKREGVFSDQESESGILLSVLSQAFHVILTGRGTSEPGLEELFDATGVGAIARDEWNGLGPIAPDTEANSRLHRRILRRLQLDRLEASILRASIEDLVEARDLSCSLVPVLLSAGEVGRWTTQLPDAFGFGALGRVVDGASAPLGRDLFIGRLVPLMLVLLDEIPNFRVSLEMLLAQGPQLGAQASLLKALPAEFRSTDGARKLRRRPKDEQQRLIREWATSHPAEAALAGLNVTLA